MNVISEDESFVDSASVIGGPKLNIKPETENCDNSINALGTVSLLKVWSYNLNMTYFLIVYK